MFLKTFTRRDLLSKGSAAALAGAAASLFPAQATWAQPDAPAPMATSALSPGPIERAYAFLDLMMDAYATGSTVRMAQSYSDQAQASSVGAGQNYQGLLGPVALLYDNAVAIHAYLARGDAEGLARADILGQALLYTQAHIYNGNFTANDISGLAQAYYVNMPDKDGVYIMPTLAEIELDYFNFSPRRLGDIAWAGMALLQLYQRTGNKNYLTSATDIGNSIVANNPPLNDGLLGFSWGQISDEYDGEYIPAPYGRSCEFNIAAGGFFSMLSRATQGGSSGSLTPWLTYAESALSLAVALYQPGGPFLYVGTTPDQQTVVRIPGPESCQSWSYLALLDAQSRGTLDWAFQNLSTVDTAAAPHSSLTGSQTVSGLAYSTTSLVSTSSDPAAVWLEGTAHMATALVARALRSGEPLHAVLADLKRANVLLDNLSDAQQMLGTGQTVAGKAIPDGLGLVAASSVTDAGQVNAGLGGANQQQLDFIYGPWLHLGATAWFLLASLGANPFQLGYR